MELDFTKLKELKKQPAKQPLKQSFAGGEYGSLSENKNAAQGDFEGVGALQRKADQIQAEREQARAVYAKYQDNIRLTEQLQAEILKGATAGEDITVLFLKAAKAISLMISNDYFYKQLEKTIAARE